MDPKRLREETRAEHEATEAAMPLMGEGLTRERYGEVLLAMLPLVGGWESWAAAWAPAGLERMVAARRRGDLLREDLEVLELSGIAAGGARRREVDWTAVVVGGAGGGCGAGMEDRELAAAFLGALYVMEGSRLGGRYLSRHVEAVLGLAPGRGDAYFLGAGEATGALWREVVARIAEVPEDLAPVVVGAARRTFGAFGEAMKAGMGAEPGPALLASARRSE